MKTPRLFATLAIVSIVLLAGCKKDDYEGKVGVCPVVISTVPTNGATGVPINQVITVTFNEKMNPATITQTSFSLQGASRISGTLVYDGSGPTFSFTPAVPLLYNTTYTGRVETSVKDMAGNALQKEYVWTFTTIEQFTVVLSSNPLAGGITTGGGSFDSGSLVTVGATANTGYTFTNWTEGTNVVSTNINYAFTISANRTLVANFTAIVNSYVITLISNPVNGGTTTGAGAYNSGTSVTAAATPNTGFTFTNWTEGGNIVSTDANYIFTITGNRTLTANFTAIIRMYILNVTAVNGTVTKNPDEAAYSSGTSVLLTATPATGYLFTSWTGDATGSENPLTVIMNSDKNITANFTAIVYTFTLSLSSSPLAGGTTTGGGTYNAGTSVTAAATPNTGFTFTNWTEGGNIVSTDANYIFTITGDRTLTANFTAIVNSYVITLISNPVNGGTTTGAGAYNSGTSVTAAATPNTGFTFTNWTEGENIVSTDANYIFTITGNRTLTANFAEIVNNYTLTVSAVNGSVTKNPDQATYTSGTSVQLTATPNSGYTFTSWSGDATGSANPLTVIMNSNKNITANFTAIVYTLTVTAVNGSVTKNPDQATYTSGTSVQLTATPNSGYTFTSWSGDATGSANPLTVVMNSNKNITANFAVIVNNYTLTVTAVNGSVTKNPDQATYTSGTSVQLTATPNSGYTFTSWSGDATGSANPLTVVMNSNKNITANFTKDPTGPGVVDLGTAGDFSILTKSGISTTGTTSITGDIGVSPAAATYITGFGLIMDANGQSSHTPIVTGKVYASDYAAPTPSKLTTAVSDMETAYTTANGLTVPAPIVGLYAGDISGRDLPAGLYKWSTGVLITNAGVTLTGGPNDTWVFQIAQDLTVNNSAIITLAGGALAKNIFWVVAGQANLGTDVIFSGNILSKTLISLNSSTHVTGRLLAQTAVTIIASTVIKP